MKSFALAVAAAGMVAVVTAQSTSQSATQGVEQPIISPVANTPTHQGCFSSSGNMVLVSNETWNSIGLCAGTICKGKYNKAVAASGQGVQCWCGDSYPPKNDLLPDGNCSIPCPGYGQFACGGPHTFTVYNTGLDPYNVQYLDQDQPSSSSSSSVGTGATVVVTATSSNAGSSSSGPNTAGIAAGVVVAVLVVAGIVGGVFFYLRHKRNRELEQEHARSAAVTSFISGGKPPSSSGGFSLSDSRLDPVMAQRRLSDGSIADNQDYSRKILRVTNA